MSAARPRRCVRARGGQARTARGEHQAPLHHVHGGGEHQRPRREGDAPAIEQAPERQLEEVEAEVAAEERVHAAEGRRVAELDDGVPRSAPAGAGHEGDQRRHRHEETPDEGLDAGAAGQAELVLQLPEHVGRRHARGHPEIGEQEGPHREAQPDHEPAPEGQDGGEDVDEADFLEPEPVGVERDRLADDAQEEEGEQDPELRDDVAVRSPQWSPESRRPTTLGRGAFGVRWRRTFRCRVSRTTGWASCWAVPHVEPRVPRAGRRPRAPDGRSAPRQTPASSRRSLTRSVRSQVNSGSLRPKWPKAAVFL